MTRLNATMPPAGVPPRRGRQFGDGALLFTRAEWADQAAALGWLAVDHVGCDRIKLLEWMNRAYRKSVKPATNGDGHRTLELYLSNLSVSELRQCANVIMTLLRGSVDMIGE